MAGGGDVLGGEWVDWPLVQDWDRGRYREAIVSSRRWLELVVRHGPEVEAVRAAAVLLSAGGLTVSSTRALAARFPQADGRRS